MFTHTSARMMNKHRVCALEVRTLCGLVVSVRDQNGLAVEVRRHHETGEAKTAAHFTHTLVPEELRVLQTIVG
jgi:hypothetical protein